ncbi:MAG: CoA pyrophosphatase [Flavobacteriaceae bacterium]|nr:CoA pyrophosphatase [Flavobacteriaceae bacterium]
MQFEEFLSLVPKLEKIPLTGVQSHRKMAPLMRIKDLQRDLRHFPTARQAGVLCLCYPDAHQQTKIVLTLRHDYDGVHARQVSFPGGKMEPDDAGQEHTSLRETEEEIGVPATSVNLVRGLTEVFIPPSNFIVKPFLGYTNAEPFFRIQESEVADLVLVPLQHLLEESFVTTISLDTSYAKQIEVPAFHFNKHVVWGATAMMLAEIKDVIKMCCES